MSTKPDELITIDLADLDDVSGGTSSTDDQIQAALSGIQDSIKGLADQRSNNNGGISFDQMMTFLVFMRNGTFSAGGGSGIVCGCGCGGRGRCCRR